MDRVKDPHDFMAYPALFKRTFSSVSLKKTPKNRKKDLKQEKSQVNFSQLRLSLP